MDEFVSKKLLVAKFNELASKYTDGDKRQRGLAYSTAADIIAFADAADVQPAKPWISVKDRQPKCIHGSSDSVLVYRDNGECEVAYLVYDKDDGFYWYTQDERSAFEFEEVTHWMPLPDPPKDGETK